MAIKKYVNALVKTTTKDHLESLYLELLPLVELSKSEKYNLIISSPLVSKSKKVEFLIDILNIKDQKLKNLFKLISKNDKLKELPLMVALLKDIIANLTGNYKGYIYSQESLTESKVADIESKLSKKFGRNITLTQQTFDKEGIQVYVDSLNVEIAVYENDIKAKLIENIIRAI